jgi:hypothetical protein
MDGNERESERAGHFARRMASAMPKLEKGQNTKGMEN